tara:strand:+ start:123 stop:383 length:261 start_codon:yes stop_codon:yes gene_type:complete
MNVTINGKIRYIGKETNVSGEKGEHVFVILVVETLEDSYLAIHCWDELASRVDELKVNQIVELDCRLESHRNRKNKDLWYHKLLLQ